jgi:hypothetical protein
MSSFKAIVGHRNRSAHTDESTPPERARAIFNKGVVDVDEEEEREEACLAFDRKTARRVII